MRLRPRMRWRLAVGALVPLAAGCGRVEAVREVRRPAASPYEAYALALREAGLDRTALGHDWAAAAQRASREPAGVGLPFHEVGYLPPEQPTALAYRFTVRHGRRLTVTLRLAAADSTRVFLDLFYLAGDSMPAPRRVASADSGSLRLEYEPRRDGNYLLRLQPELLRGGRYTLVISAATALSFPVSGAGRRNIRSVFGDPRDGGVRDHHGIDIFASRGTPALAAAEGTVTRVRTTPLGGKVVWVRDRERGQSLYYAHLDSQLVVLGQRVRPGDTLGLIGNTGNARTTPPHLHFGIYRRGVGPVDPLPFVVAPAGGPPELAADTAVLGHWTRALREGLRLRAGPDPHAARLADLPLHTAMRVLAASGRWYRVRLPDGTYGYVAGWLTEAARAPIDERTARAPEPLLARPAPGAPIVASLDAGEPLPVLGRFGEFLMVRAPGGLIGWLPDD